MPTLRRTRIASPIGPLDAVAGPHGLLSLTITALAEPGKTMAENTVAEETMPEETDSNAGGPEALLDLVHIQLDEYFAGARQRFTIPLDWQPITGVRRDVLRTLAATVPYGHTTSYGRLAAEAGKPGAARLVGTIMGGNPLPILVPCHRVIASDGTLGGYGGGHSGVAVKRTLLELEGALPGRVTGPASGRFRPRRPPRTPQSATG